MNTLLHEYHARLGAALEGDNRLAAIELLHAEMQARIAALEPMAQESMFPAGEDAPLFTLPDDAEPVIELNYKALSTTSVDVCLDCIEYAWPKNTVEGCWAHLERLLAGERIPQTQYDEIKKMADFVIAD